MFFILCLAQNGPDSKVPSVAHDFKGQLPIRWLDGWGCNECLFQDLKGFKALIVKDERCFFSQKSCQGFEKSL